MRGVCSRGLALGPPGRGWESCAARRRTQGRGAVLLGGEDGEMSRFGGKRGAGR